MQWIAIIRLISALLTASHVVNMLSMYLTVNTLKSLSDPIVNIKYNPVDVECDVNTEQRPVCGCK